MNGGYHNTHAYKSQVQDLQMPVGETSWRNYTIQVITFFTDYQENAQEREFFLVRSVHDQTRFVLSVLVVRQIHFPFFKFVVKPWRHRRSIGYTCSPPRRGRVCGRRTSFRERTWSSGSSGPVDRRFQVRRWNPDNHDMHTPRLGSWWDPAGCRNSKSSTMGRRMSAGVHRLRILHQ